MSVRAVRLSLVALVCGLAALSGWWYLTTSQAVRLARELELMRQEMAARIAERDAMIARLSRDHRRGLLEVLAQRLDADGEVAETTVRFVELDDAGREIGRMDATLPGSTIFVDAWVARFDREHVAGGHPFKGRTLVLLRRLYSDRLAPRDGVTIDTPGAIPDGYAVGAIAEFEHRLWKSFWTIASDPKLAAQFGVRIAQGEAVYLPVTQGDRLELLVEASGGMTIRKVL